MALDIPYACNSFGPRSGFLPEDFPGKSQQRIVPLDRARMIGHFSDSLGIEIPLAPFFGSMGVAPATGRLNSAPPTMHAGNLDNKELQAGTILYIPVKAKGALFEAGANLNGLPHETPQGCHRTRSKEKEDPCSRS